MFLSIGGEAHVWEEEVVQISYKEENAAGEKTVLG